VSEDAITSKINERIGASTCRPDGMADATRSKTGVKTGKAVPSKGAIAEPVVAAAGAGKKLKQPIQLSTKLPTRA